MGGGFALRAARTFPDRVVAVGTFHGGNLATDAFDSPHPLASRIKAKAFVASGENEASFDLAQKDRLAKAMKKAGVDAEMIIYEGASRGYAPSDMPAYNRKASERHWRDLLALLQSTLRWANKKAARWGGLFCVLVRNVLGRRLLGELGLELALDLQGAGRELPVAGLQKEDIQATPEVQSAQGRVGDPQGEGLTQGVRLDLHRRQVRHEPALGLDVRVTHVVADHRANTGEFAAA